MSQCLWDIVSHLLSNLCDLPYNLLTRSQDCPCPVRQVTDSQVCAIFVLLTILQARQKLAALPTLDAAEVDSLILCLEVLSKGECGTAEHACLVQLLHTCTDFL